MKFNNKSLKFRMITGIVDLNFGVKFHFDWSNSFSDILMFLNRFCAQYLENNSTDSIFCFSICLCQCHLPRRIEFYIPVGSNFITFIFVLLITPFTVQTKTVFDPRQELNKLLQKIPSEDFSRKNSEVRLGNNPYV